MTEKKISVLLNSDGDRAQMDQSIQSLMNQSSGYWRDTELLIFLKKEECQDENADLKEYLQILKMKNPQIKIVEYEDSIWKAYDEAVEISLEELKTMVPVRDPLWEEEERLREEYIKIHGERVYDDEEDE